MKTLSLSLLLTSIALADGGFSGSPSCDERDWTYDEVKTTIWKPVIKSVKRNGVVVDTGTVSRYDYATKGYLSAPVSQLDELRINAMNGENSPDDVWNKLNLNGGPFEYDQLKATW